MKIISIAARKGGVDKTTLAAHFSVIAVGDGRCVLLFDTDQQGSLAWWWRLREGETPALVECKAGELGSLQLAANWPSIYLSRSAPESGSPDELPWPGLVGEGEGSPS